MIANQHGWTIHTPAACAATWTGDPSTQGLTVHGGPAISHFGSGVLTWHVPYLFRTADPNTDVPWSLYVKGPANTPKDGIIPLEGVVETDWASATFTMNWLFTRPCSVIWAPDEAYCHVFPVQRGTLDQAVPEIRSVTDDPELADRYREWSLSRGKFNGSPARGNDWEKHYHQGRHSDGCPAGTMSHQTRLRVPPFKEMT